MKKLLVVALLFSQSVFGAQIPSNTLTLGQGAAANESIFFNIGNGIGANPVFRWNNSTGAFQLSTNGSVFSNIIGTTQPTVQKFLVTGTQTGLAFTVTSANATAGATYTNNGHTYTVLSTIAAGTLLFVSGTGSTSGSTLTHVGGTGDSTITFSANTTLGTYTLPTSPSPLYIRVQGVGGGGGGASSNTTGNNGVTGGATYFGPTLVIATGGGGGIANANGASSGGTVTVTGGLIGPTWPGAGSTSGNNAGVAPSGADSCFGGAGVGGQPSSGSGGNAATNTGAGGGAGNNGTSNGSGGAAGGCFDLIVNSPSASYYYGVGAGGATGSGGTAAGGSGAAGILNVWEYYQ